MVFDDCVASVTLDRRQRLDRARGDVISVDADYMESIRSGTAHVFPAASFEPDLKKDLKWLYETKLRDERRSDELYDEILLLAAGDCPYCGLDSPKQLDHCLPKSAYPHLSVTPLNLVPVCIACNFLKSDEVGASLNAYFDDWAIDVTWLLAEMPDPTRPWCLEFSVGAVGSWNADQRRTVEASFLAYGLGSRYSDRVVTRWNQFSSEYAGVFNQGGVSSLANHFLSKLRSSTGYRLNSWESATYRCWLMNVGRADWAA